MSDLEFEVLDELYFVTHFSELVVALGLEDGEIKPVLAKLLKKGWLRCFADPDVELDEKDIDIEVSFRSYYYLASKEGLMAHNKS